MAKTKASAPSRPGTERIPLGTLNQWKPVHNIRTIVFFIVRQVLDEDLLRESLDKLIRNHLPILGARIEPTGPKSLPLQYNLPKPFPENYELFRWSCKSTASSFESEKLLPVVDNPKGIITWGRSIPDLEAQWSPENWPVERKHEEPDTPIILVHITNYTDATVVTTNIPHAVCDQVGYASFMRAWLQVAKGETPPPFLELSHDALDGTKGLPREVLRRKGAFRLTTTQERIRAYACYGPELMTQSEEDRRLMFLSGSLISKLRARHNEALKEKYGSDAPVLSSGDIIAAIATKLGQLHRKTPKLMTLSGYVNARGRHASLPADKPYLHNAVAHNTAVFPISRDTPLVEIARQNRLSIERDTIPESLDRHFAVTKAMQEAGYSFAPTHPGSTSMAMTNWCTAWRGISFAPVVAGKEAENVDGDVGGTHTKGNGEIDGNGASSAGETPLNESGSDGVAPSAVSSQAVPDTALPIILGHSLERHIKICRYNCQIMCREQGGFWVDFACSTKNMALVDKLLKRDPLLETI